MITDPVTQPDQNDNSDSWYSPCPACGLVGPAASAEYVQTGLPPLAHPDWSQPVIVRCEPCGRIHAVTRDGLLDRDGRHGCRRCQQVTRVPAAAAVVICLECGFYSRGPAALASPALSALVNTIRQKHAAELRARLLLAKTRFA